MNNKLELGNRRRLDNSRIVNLERGKIPPQAVDLEETILGAMMIDRKGVDDCLEVISSGDVFYKDAHQLIFIAIQDLNDNNQPVDLLTVSKRLKEMGSLESVGGDHYLINLTQKVASSAHIEYHSRVVLQKYMARSIIRMSNEAIENAYDETSDVFDVLDLVSMQMDKITEIFQKGKVGLEWADACDQVLKKVELLSNNQGEITGITTGLDRLDKFTNGWQPTDLIILGGDSGSGKTALAMRYLLSPAKQGIPVAMLSMEMSTVQLAIRGSAVESNFHMRQLTKEGFDKPKYFVALQEVVDNLRSLPIYIDDTPSLTIPVMKRRARQLKRKHDIKILIVDFIQMFSGDEDDIKLTGWAARELKNLAKELNIAVIALSQLNREVRKAKDSIPEKWHLKNSSGIEEAADIITLLYRPGYYGFNRDNSPTLWYDLNLEGSQNAVLKFAKNRNGGLGHIPLTFIEDKTKYVNDFETNNTTPF